MKRQNFLIAPSSPTSSVGSWIRPRIVSPFTADVMRLSL
jgi:hypothetical protein